MYPFVRFKLVSVDKTRNQSYKLNFKLQVSLESYSYIPYISWDILPCKRWMETPFGLKLTALCFILGEPYIFPKLNNGNKLLKDQTMLGLVQILIGEQL